jgi:hypothetical protein
MTVTVNAQTTPTFTQVAAICSGSTFTLPTTSNNGITGTWSPAINNTATTTYTFTPGVGQCATTATMTVTVNLLPTVGNVADVVRCGAGSVTLSANTPFAGAVIDWYAAATGGTALFTGDNFTTPVLSTTTTYYVEARNPATGCVSNAPRTAVTATIDSLPTPVSVVNGNTLSTTQTYSTYQWMKSGVDIPGATNATYIATESADYSVRVTNSNGCEGISNTVTHVYLGVSDAPEKQSLKVYPNPTSGELRIENGELKINSVEIYDITGKKIPTPKFSTINSQFSIKLDILNLPQGTYLLKINNETVKVIKK